MLTLTAVLLLLLLPLLQFKPAQPHHGFIKQMLQQQQCSQRSSLRASETSGTLQALVAACEQVCPHAAHIAHIQLHASL